MSENTHKPKKTDKDDWDKWKIILEPLGGLLTAVAVVYLTYYTSRQLESWHVIEDNARARAQAREETARAHWQEKENNARVYTELMGKREEAETGLRKAMFDSIMTAFLKASAGSEEAKKVLEPAESDQALEADVLKMELLAYNFHESLNLTPLFKNLERIIEKRLETYKATNLQATGLKEEQTDPEKSVAKKCLLRLRKVANEIIERQLAALQNADGKNSAVFQISNFEQPLPLSGEYVTKTLTLGGVTHEVMVGIMAKDVHTQELQVTLSVRTKDPQHGADTEDFPERHSEFWIGSFEFPMIDNTRLPNDQFCSVILKVYEKDPKTSKVYYEIHVVCFPGSRVALKEKPYYDEILDHLRQTNSVN